MTILSREPEQPEISGLRGLALLMVVGGHFVQRIERFNPPDQPYGWQVRLLVDSVSSPAAGVYLFFAISGYLIARSLSGRALSDPAGLSRFYLRRAARIAPPYIFVLVLTWLVLTICAWEPPRTYLYNVRPESLLDSLIASVFFLHGVLYGTFPRLFPPGWTLEIEVQFYLAAPFVCLAFRHVASRFGLGTASACAFAATGFVAALSLRSGLDQLQPTIFVYMPLFVLGIVAYHVRRSGWRPRSRLAPMLGCVALIGFVVLQPWVGGSVDVEIAVRMALIAVMFIAVAAGRGALFRVCTHRVLVTIGVLSYSAYLVHLQVLHMVAAVIARYVEAPSTAYVVVLNLIASGALICGTTLIFFAMIERPALRLSDWGRSRDARPLRIA